MRFAESDTSLASHTLILDGVWSLSQLPLEAEGAAGYAALAETDDQPLECRVPGEVHLDLIRVGRMKDPSLSDNARTECRWPEQYSWWYRTELEVPPSFLAHPCQRLTFEGIDLYGQIFINGVLVGVSENAFAPLKLDMNGLLVEGANELVVRVTSGMERVSPPAFNGVFGETERLRIADRYSVRSFDQRRLSLRKPAYATYGWDFCDPLPNIGIWQSVRLEGRSGAVIDHLRLDTVIADDDVCLEGEVTLDNLHPWAEIACIVEMQLVPPDGETILKRFEVSLPPGRSRVPCRLLVPEPRLWWPNGMGEQPLYELTVRVLSEADETDRQVQTIGLRTIELDRSPLVDGSRFCFKVNGVDVFCKGANWAPVDLIPARVGAARYEQLVAEAQNAHFTMFRVNGTGLYESESFYAACDRAGILVWQDFAFSCGQYPDSDQAFMGLVRAEAEAAVKRLRHHPSLAVWCGNNECAMCMVMFWTPDLTRPQDHGGDRIYNELLPDICHLYDPARSYWPSSPLGGPDPNNESSGDVHGWEKGVPGLTDDMRRRNFRELADRSRARFFTETFNNFAPPHLDSIREYLGPDELALDSTSWKIHTNALENGETAAGIEHHYGHLATLSVQDFVLYGQMYQALMHGNTLESMRFRKGDPEAECQGALAWSYNETWGELGWAIVDHYLRRKASYYWVKRSAAPVKVLVRSRDAHLVTRVVNDTLNEYNVRVRCGRMRLDGRARELTEHELTIPPNAMVEVRRDPLPALTSPDRGQWLYAAVLTGEEISADQAIWLLAPHRELDLAPPALSTSVVGRHLVIESPVYCHGVHFEDGGREVLADNYFDLLPGIPRRIAITKPTPSGAYPFRAVLPLSERR